VAAAAAPGVLPNAGPAAAQVPMNPMAPASTNTEGMWHKYCSFMVSRSHPFLGEQIFFEIEF
jgi:hypothetical protein